MIEQLGSQARGWSCGPPTPARPPARLRANHPARPPTHALASPPAHLRACQPAGLPASPRAREARRTQIAQFEEHLADELARRKAEGHREDAAPSARAGQIQMGSDETASAECEYRNLMSKSENVESII